MPNRPDPHEVSGLHVLVAENGGNDARALRGKLRSGIDRMLSDWGWQWARMGNGHRICCLDGGEPAPPVSVSYSGPVALLLVSADWRGVGVDIEISQPRRSMRYALITESFTGHRPEDAFSMFVRAEAWAKAVGCGFIFGPAYFLRESVRPGLRRDGRLLRDVALGAELFDFVSRDSLVATAVCTESGAPEPVIHPYRILKSAERSAS